MPHIYSKEEASVLLLTDQLDLEEYIHLLKMKEQRKHRIEEREFINADC